MTPAENRTQLLYIAGSGRSGSTLLDRLLDGHPRVTGLGEVHRLSLQPSRRRCGCGETVNACPFWQKVIAEVASDLGLELQGWPEKFPTTIVRDQRHYGIGRPSLYNALLVAGSRKLIRLAAKFSLTCGQHLRIGRNSWLLYDVIRQHTSAQVLVDSTKNAARMKLLYLLRPSAMKILHLVRDGRAVASSARRREGIPIAEGARSWRRANRHLEWAVRSIPEDCVLRIRYEDLCSDSRSVLMTICEFVQLEFDASVLSASRVDYHQIPGNPMLYEQKSVRIAEDRRWVTEFTAEDEETFWREAGRMNQRYGY